MEVDPEQPIKKKKVPRRLIHCSDGVLEEYSTDEEEEVKPPEPTINPVKNFDRIFILFSVKFTKLVN